MTYQEESKPVQTVETSQKYMAWNIKEISESLKVIAKYVEILAKQQMSQPQRSSMTPPVRSMHNQSEEVPF